MCCIPMRVFGACHLDLELWMDCIDGTERGVPWQTRVERELDEMQARLEKADRVEERRRKALERQEDTSLPAT